MGYLTQQLEKLASSVEQMATAPEPPVTAPKLPSPAEMPAGLEGIDPATLPGTGRPAQSGTIMQLIIARAKELRKRKEELMKKLEQNRLPEGMNLKEYTELTGERPKGLRM